MSSTLPLHLFSFKGRINRLSYLGYSIGSVVAGTAGVWFAAFLSSNPSSIIFVAMALMAIFMIATFWLTFSLAVKRLHDIGSPGTTLIGAMIALALLSFLDHAGVLSTLLAIAFNALLFFKPGQPEANAWGPPPISGTKGLVSAE